MKITKTPFVGAFIIMMLLWAGCGGSSAPPVDLPAPITGRIDVSSPDANGDVTITGDADAVTGGTIVMVVNEDAAAAAWMILDMLVPNAYAQTFPSICDTTGHACTESADDGSFQLTIPAAVGDTLTIGLIDENGDWISDTISTTVPESGTPDPTANCAAEDVTGKVVDIKIAPTSGIPVMLREGSATTTNQLVIGYDSPTTVDIVGCHAHSLAFFPSTYGDSIAVTSQGDKKLWAARFVSGEIRDSRSFDLDYEPMNIIFVNLATKPTVAIRATSNTITLNQISTSSGAVGAGMLLLTSATTEVTGITRSTALRITPMEGDILGFLITDDGNPVNSYATLFQATSDGAKHKGTWSRSNMSDLTYPLSSMVDGIVYSTASPSGFMRFAVLDSAGTGNTLKRFHIMTAGPELGWNDDLSTAVLTVPTLEAKVAPDIVGDPFNNIALNDSAFVNPRAIVTDDHGRLYQNILTADLSKVVYIADWALNNNIVAMDLLPTASSLYGADATSDAMIDGSSLVTW